MLAFDDVASGVFDAIPICGLLHPRVFVSSHGAVRNLMSASSSTTTQPGLRFPFRTKLTIAASLLAVVPLVALSVRLLDVADTTVRTMSQEYQNAIADDVARTIDHTLGTAQDGLDAIGRTLTDATIASTSSGTSVRRSMISASMPCSSAAACATWTRVP